MTDTGDVLLMEHVCSKTLTVSAMQRCYFDQFLRKPSTDWDSAGLLVRTHEEPRVLFKFYGAFFEVPYDEFLRMPFFETIGLRKLVTCDPKTGYVSQEFVDSIRRKQGKLGNGNDLILEYWLETGLSKSPLKRLKLDEVNRNVPCGFIQEKGKYSETIIVRTQFSRKEAENY